MRKLSIIKYKYLYRQALNLPKYLALAGLVYSGFLPLMVTADAEFALPQKPALLALAETNTFSSPFIQALTQESDPLTIVHGSAITGQMNPLAYAQNYAGENQKKTSIQASIISASPNSSTHKVIVTAYSSTPDQTDSSPFITAKGTQVRDGIVACNFLKFGTMVRLPEVYGDKIFVVEDRMAKYNSHKIDIWMETRAEALQFGVKYLTVEVLEL
jgi:3D (Asp-Asp-Asp) domain-containing protein